MGDDDSPIIPGEVQEKLWKVMHREDIPRWWVTPHRRLGGLSPMQVWENNKDIVLDFIPSDWHQARQTLFDSEIGGGTGEESFP